MALQYFENKNLMRNGHYQFNFADLIDSLTIQQIKETKGSFAATVEIQQISKALDQFVREKNLKANPQILQAVILIAQANLLVWHHKDRMQQQPHSYNRLLDFAQDLNSLKNEAKNLLLQQSGEFSLASKRSVLFNSHVHDGWFEPVRNILAPLRSGLSSNGMNARHFAAQLGIPPSRLTPRCKAIICKSNFRFCTLKGNEREQKIAEIVHKINSNDWWKSGKTMKHIWEKGWNENLKKFQKTKKIQDLFPKFLQRDAILRLNQEYIRPLDRYFEYNYVNVLRHWLFENYFKNVDAIYEFGCGSCQHLPTLAELFPHKMIHGIDWTQASKKILQVLSRKYPNLKGHLFNMFKPSRKISLEKNSGVFTIGAMEQMGRDFKPFLNFLIKQKPQIVWHMETVKELYDPNQLMDQLALSYDQKRHYLEGYLDALKRLEKQKKIEILKMKRIYFGSLFHDSYSLIVWRPR